MTRSLAAACPEVRVNAAAWVTPRHPGRKAARGAQALRRGATAVLKRRAKPEDIAEVVLFVLVGAAMITGQTIIADGGMTFRRSLRSTCGCDATRRPGGGGGKAVDPGANRGLVSARRRSMNRPRACPRPGDCAAEHGRLLLDRVAEVLRSLGAGDRAELRRQCRRGLGTGDRLCGVVRHRPAPFRAHRQPPRHVQDRHDRLHPGGCLLAALRLRRQPGSADSSPGARRLCRWRHRADVDCVHRRDGALQPSADDARPADDRRHPRLDRRLRLLGHAGPLHGLAARLRGSGARPGCRDLWPVVASAEARGPCQAQERLPRQPAAAICAHSPPALAARGAGRRGEGSKRRRLRRHPLHRGAAGQGARARHLPHRRPCSVASGSAA